MIAEDIEFQISQYVDGTLSTTERASVDALIASDPAVQQLLEDYRKLDSQLVSLSTSSPTVNWDRFSTRVSNAIDEADAPVVAGRIGFGVWAGRLRIAATILIAATIGIVVHRGKQTTVSPSLVAPLNHPVNAEVEVTAPAGIAEVRGPEAEFAAGASSEDISVGPSTLAASLGASKYADLMVVPGQSKVVISQAIGMRTREKSRPH